MKKNNIDYRFVVMLIVLVILALVHNEELMPVRVGLSDYYGTTSYTIERFVFLAIGVFGGAFFGKRIGIIFLCVAFSAMLVNALVLDSGRARAMIETPFIFLTGLFIVFLFESRRKVAIREKALKEAQSLGRIGSWEYETKTRKITWSDVTYVLYERDPALGPPRPEEALGYYSPAQADELKDLVKNAKESGKVQSLDIELKLPGGLSAFHHIIIKPEKNIRGNVTKLSGTVQDVTEHKRAERLRDEFIGLVSHELRTPLTVIRGSLQVALDGKTSLEDVRELLEIAISDVDNLYHILENLVEMARWQAGKLQLNIKNTDVTQVFRKVIDKLKKYGATQSFLLEEPEDLPRIEADPVRVERILYNLLDNAVKYSPRESEIRIQASTENEFMIVKIIDQGAGLSEEEQGNLFQQFGRIGAEKTNGMGLGLIVCKRLLEMHGGWIRVESKPGLGSTFSFGLPLVSR